MIALAGIYLITRPSASSSAPAPAKPVRAEAAQRVLQARLAARRREIGAYRQFTWNCQDTIGTGRSRASVAVWALPRSHPYRVWVRDLWKTRYQGCKVELERRTIPSTGDWQVAVSFVQRIYPGTGRWLLDCSSGEGGHGGWVPNHQGSGASGWMQFMRSTFYAHVRAAFADARARGFILDRTWESWYSPLGQAVTAAWMRIHGMSHHWDPGVDPLCR